LPAIQVTKLVKEYEGKRALDEVDLSVKEGEFYALMGPNGSGKTTLISILASVILPTSGRAEVLGGPPGRERHRMGYVPQANFTSPALSARENLMYFANLLGHTGADARDLVSGLLDRVELSQDADKRVSEFSGGMRKRLEVATALFPGIDLVLLDEPTTGLDPSARRRFFGLIQEVKKDMTILLITHIGSDAELASRVGLINAGKLLAEGTPDELKHGSGLHNVINIETAAKNDKALEALRAHSEGGEVIETDVGYRIFSTDYERTAPEAMRVLDAAGAKVMEIQSATPSLEDVFFKLTGKTVGEVE
jgi:ABC-type multidrug transport system ATPase subunit